jgi:hypothetical protein
MRTAWYSRLSLHERPSLTLSSLVRLVPAPPFPQLYAPLRSTFGSHVGSFHRTLFLFCCMDESCTNREEGTPRTNIVCVRSQLPLVNKFYPDVAMPRLEEWTPPAPAANATPAEKKQQEVMPVNEDAPAAGVHLCCVCGNPAPSSCSRCHARRYCSKLHQTYDWRQGHKAICGTKAADDAEDAASSPPPAPPASLLFPQKEVVIEPENEDASDSEGEDESDATKAAPVAASSGSNAAAKDTPAAAPKPKGKKKVADDFTKEKKLLEAYEKQKAEDEEDAEDEEGTRALEERR